MDEETAALLINNVAVLSSILAGFSFTVVVQLALAKERDGTQGPIRASFIAFLGCTVALVASVVAGAMFVVPGNPNKGEGPLGAIWLLGLLVGAVSFGCGLISLGWIHSRTFGLLATIAGIVFLVLLAVAPGVRSGISGILLVTRRPPPRRLRLAPLQAVPTAKSPVSALPVASGTGRDSPGTVATVPVQKRCGSAIAAQAIRSSGAPEGSLSETVAWSGIAPGNVIRRTQSPNRRPFFFLRSADA